MMVDIWTVMWKEWKELLQARGNRRSSLWMVLMNVGIFGAFMPWQFGLQWLNSLWTVFWMLFVASFWTTNLIADSFAGERERRTLETLLASRLSNRAILLGKYAAALAYVGGQILVSLLLGAVVVSLAHGRAARSKCPTRPPAPRRAGPCPPRPTPRWAGRTETARARGRDSPPPRPAED